MRNVYISGAITGHEEEAKELFIKAEKAVLERFPGCKVFNPIKLPKLPSWETYMKICRVRVSGWAHKIVFIESPHLNTSRGVAEERVLALDKKLDRFLFANGRIEEEV